MAPLLGLPLQHTVGDVIATEREGIAVCGNDAWREITALTGWDIPDSNHKSPQATHACWELMSGTASMATNPTSQNQELILLTNCHRNT